MFLSYLVPGGDGVLHAHDISELERGRKAGSLTALRAIALALSVPLSSLLAEAEKATTPRRR